MSGIAIAVVSYNTREVLRACLDSAVKQDPPELIVADNGSTDGSIEMISRHFPHAVVDVDARNLGYGAAGNRAVARSQCDAILLLNSDTILPSTALSTLRTYLDAHPRAGIVGPRLVNPDGSLQRSCHHFPSPLVTLLENSWLGTLVERLPGGRSRYLNASDHDRARVVDWVTGAALLLRRPAFTAVGGFDEQFFMYYEEVDLAYRMRKAGWETHFAPVASVTHIGGSSTSARFGAMYAQEFAALMQYYRLHLPERVARGRAAVRLAMLSKLAWHGLTLPFTRDRSRRRALIERSIPAWWRVLLAPNGES